MDTQKEVLAILDDVLCLKGRSAQLTATSPLLGALPELDSMAVIALINSFEKHFGFQIDDDEIEGSFFVTVGSLVEFVQAKRLA